MLRGLVSLTITLFSFSLWANCGSTDQFYSVARNTMAQAYSSEANGQLTLNNKILGKPHLGSEAIFSEMAQLVATAKKQVFIQTWRFDYNSLPARYIAGGLQKLAELKRKRGDRNPVDVWFMINIIDTQNRNVEKEEIEKYLKHHSLHNQWVRMHVGIYNADFLAANHAKNLIVDNSVAMVTGANISHNFDKSEMFDVGYKVSGEVVDVMSDDFIQIWKNHISNEIKPAKTPAPQVTGCRPILFTRNPSFSQLVSTPRQSSINSAMLFSVNAAKRTIDIMTPNLNNPGFKSVIKEAIKRKVTVRIILSKGHEAFSENLPTRGGDNLKSVGQLYRSLGTHANRPYLCHYLKVRWYSRDGKKAHKGTAKNSHAKYMSVDNQIYYIGSANMDNQSWANSREIGLFIDANSEVKKWTQSVFNPIFNKAIDVQECGGPAEPTPHNNNNDR